MELKEALKEKQIICLVWNNGSVLEKFVRVVDHYISVLNKFTDAECCFWENAVPLTIDDLKKYTIDN
jgi:hypothetical protein